MDFFSIPSSRVTSPRSSDLTLTLSPPQFSKPLHANPNVVATPLRHQQQQQQQQNQQQKQQENQHSRIRLSELLLTCAAHTASSNLPRAEACLRLLSTLSSASSSDPSQRLAAHLATALAARLLRRRYAGLLFALHHPAAAPRGKIRAHLAFARALPYLPAARAVAICTLLRAVAHERDVHFLDLGPTASSGDLWVPLLRALARQPGGLPRVQLTCVGTDTGVLDALGVTLSKEASILDIPLQFNEIESQLSELDLGAVPLRRGEALAVVCTLSLHKLLTIPEVTADVDENGDEDWVVGQRKLRKRLHTSSGGFLMALRLMSPKAVVVVEQESDHNCGRMVERFTEAMRYYGAMFESVEAAAAAGGGLEAGKEREAVEEMLGREMENVVACEGEERVERHERSERWTERMRRAGFRQARVLYDAEEEAKRVVAVWAGKGSYGVAVDRGCLMICWKDRPLFAVSIWC